MKRMVGWILAAAALGGCGVSKDLYLQKESELAACRTGAAAAETALTQCRQEVELRQQDLEARRKQQGKVQQELDACLTLATAGTSGVEECRKKAAEDLAACRAESEKAGAELGRARQELTACRGEGDALRKEVDGLKAREQELRARLEKELRDQTVEIERLRAKLSVRVVDHILFESGRAEILKEGRAVLDKVAEVVAGSSESVRVEGHSDDVPVSKRLKGKFYSNWELSAARAANVVRYFQYAKGVDPTRMEAVGLAHYRPDAPNDTYEGRAQNRRVVIVLTPVREAPKEEPAASQATPRPGG